MSYYTKQNFISPSRLFAEIKEEMRTYFTSGIVDDLMFPIWTERVLSYIRKSAFPIKETVLEICGNTACLPDDFQSVREAWACVTTYSSPIQDSVSTYYQTDCRITSTEDKCDPCFTTTDPCDLEYLVVNKVTGSTILKFKRSFLLRPGNANARSYCGENCFNLGSKYKDSFDINNGKFTTTFNEGTVNLIYYAKAEQEGEQLIPDNQWVKDYIRKYIIYMCYRQIFNQSSDETFNQIRYKVEKSEQEYLDAKIMALTDLKKQSTEKLVRSIKRDIRRFKKYKL